MDRPGRLSFRLYGSSQVTGPRRLEVVPLGGRSSDQSLELVRDVLGDAHDVLPQASGAFGDDRRTDDTAVADLVVEVGGRRQDGGTRPQSQRGRAAGQLGPLAEEL